MSVLSEVTEEDSLDVSKIKAFQGSKSFGPEQQLFQSVVRSADPML